MRQWRKKSEKNKQGETEHETQRERALNNYQAGGKKEVMIAREEVKGGRKVAMREQKGRSPAVREQGQRREKCQSGLNHQ